MAVSLAPSPPPHDQRDRPPSLAVSTGSSPWAPSPARQSASPQLAYQSQGNSPAPLNFPFVAPSPALGYQGQMFVPVSQQPFYTTPAIAPGYQAVAGTSMSGPLPPPVTGSSAHMGYVSMPAYGPGYPASAPYYAPGLPTLPVLGSPYGAQQMPHFAHQGYAAFSGVPQHAVHSPAASPEMPPGAFHPYKRPPPQSASRSQSPHPRQPEQSMFSPPIGPADLARLRRDSTGSGSSARTPRDTQPFPGRIRTQSTNSNTSNPSPAQHRPSNSFGERAKTPTPPSSAVSAPRQPVPSAAPAPAPTPAQRSVSSNASAAAAVAGPPVFDKKKGNKLVGGLRRAFSMQSMSTVPTSAPRTPELSRDSTSSSGTSGGSSSPPPTPPARPMNGPPPSSKLGRLGMSRMNRSSDNLSISSTVSSASMMIRKLGQIGKRSSLSGISAIFGKDRERDEADTLRAGSELGVAPPSSKLKKKDRRKSATAEPEVSHVVAEHERAGSAGSRDGLTPAEALVKKHQQLMAQQETELEATPPPVVDDQPKRWTPSAARVSSIPSVAPKLPVLQVPQVDLDFESGPSPFSPSEEVPTPTDETPRPSMDLVQTPPVSHFEDDTASFNDGVSEYEVDPPLPQRSDSLGPVRGILKNAQSYNQEDLIKPQPVQPRAPFGARIRANSYDVPSSQALPTHHADVLASADVVDGVAPHPQRAASPIYSNPAHNSSAPMLHREKSSVQLAKRGGTLPARRCTFAQNLSVHTTWPAALYDRRGEPATCNRLTPALAQTIKEELNDFKMTEMHVHAHSRIYTHFFV